MSTSPQYPPPGVPVPPGPPSSSNRALWWVLGVIIALLLILVGGGLFIASQVIRGISVEGPNRVQIRTPAGNVNVEKLGEDVTGLPVYPNAVLRHDQGARIQFQPSQESGGVGLAAASYRSADEFDKVSSWYREKLDASFKIEKNKSVVQVNGMDVGRADLAYVSHQDDRVRIVALERRGGQTQISLVRIGKQEAQ
jgi:preprotein translocase subunit SecF